MTSDLDAVEVTQSGTLCTADVGGLRAARVEGAAAWGVERVGHFALHGGAGAAGIVHLRDRVQQHLWVRVLRVAKQRVFVRLRYQIHRFVQQIILCVRLICEHTHVTMANEAQQSSGNTCSG